jgi:hypothetical protein
MSMLKMSLITRIYGCPATGSAIPDERRPALGQGHLSEPGFTQRF